jgi:hypothetical protein
VRTLVLDFETYYADDYTLSKSTAEEYVRSDLFEIIGVSFAYLGEKPVWYSGDADYIKAVLQQIPWHETLVVGHNASMFDSLILTERCGVTPAAWGCTLQLARCINGSKTPEGKSISNGLGALAKMYQVEIEQILGRSLYKGDEVIHAKNKRRCDFTPSELAAYGRYCNDDVELCGALWRVLSPKFPQSELLLASTVTKMWAEARLVLDGPLLHAMGIEMAERKAEMLTKVAGILGVGTTIPHAERMDHTQKLLRSDAKFADILRQFDVEVPMKRSPKKRDAEGRALEVYAFAKTDAAMTELLEYEEGDDDETNLAVQALAAARLGTKSTQAEGRVARLHGISIRGPLTVPLEYGKTLTDRLAGCLVADTKIHCYDPDIGACLKNITDVLPDDLVWDGIEYVRHGGVVFQGYREVIEHDGIVGTKCHPVFIDENTTISLEEAKATGTPIMVGEPPADWVD